MTVPPGLNEPPDWDAIARHRDGELDGAEERRVAEWLAAHPRDAALLDALDEQLAAQLTPRAVPAPEPDVEAALRAVHARMDDAPTARVIPFPLTRPASGTRRRPMRWVAAGIAAAAAIGALAVGLTRDRAADGLPRPVAAGSVVATAVGVRDSVRLPDGTRVVLGPASRLTVAAGYGGSARDVEVEGVAFFDVTHLPATSFIVRAGPATIRDLGTAFTVRTEARDSARGVIVAVTVGSVELNPDHASAQSVVLRAGERGESHSDGGAIIRSAMQDSDVAWTRGRLLFADAPLTTVRADLLRWYGVELQIADSSLLTRRITASFDGEPVDSVLRVIALALGANVERRDSVAVLRSGTSR